MDLANYVEGNRAQLQDAPFGLYTVVSAQTEQGSAQPSVIYCLRQQAANANTQDTVNPLSPFFLVYIQSDGAVRYNFTAPKQVLETFRALCQGKTAPDEALCKLFDEHTRHGQDMSTYSALLDKTVTAIVAQFAKKNAAGLFAGRSAKLIDTHKAVSSNTDFELITWLIIQPQASKTA